MDSLAQSADTMIPLREAPLKTAQDAAIPRTECAGKLTTPVSFKQALIQCPKVEPRIGVCG